MNKVYAIILGCCLLFLIPMKDMAERQDSIVQSEVTTDTNQFVEAIRNNGYLTKEMYDIYLNQLDQTGNLYKIEITHEHITVTPVYDEGTGTFLEDSVTSNRNTYEDDILSELYEGSGTYKFDQGDFLSVKLYNRTRTLAGSIRQMLSFHNESEVQIYYTDGGMIRDENY